MNSRIFVIEDEPAALKNIVTMLQEEGYVIAGVAADCDKAAKMINESLTDLVICNLYLRFTFSGESIIKLIRNVKEIPFIFLSSFTHDSRLNTILRTKSEMYLCSPYTKDQLVGSVKRLLKNIHKHKKTNISPLIVI